MSEHSSISEFAACTRNGPETCFEERSDAVKVGLMSRIFVVFFGFSDFLGFRLVFGVMSSGIVLDTRSVFLNAWMAVQDLYYGRTFWEFMSKLWADISVYFMIFNLLQVLVVIFGCRSQTSVSMVTRYFLCKVAMSGVGPGTELMDLSQICGHSFDIFWFRTTISAGFRAVTMVGGLPRAFR